MPDSQSPKLSGDQKPLLRPSENKWHGQSCILSSIYSLSRMLSVLMAGWLTTLLLSRVTISMISNDSVTISVISNDNVTVSVISNYNVTVSMISSDSVTVSVISNDSLPFARWGKSRPRCGSPRKKQRPR